MVTKRYIKRGGKEYGPYYYESYRDKTGKVKKRYIKNHSQAKSQTNKNTKTLQILLGIIALIILLTVIAVNLSDSSLTGQATLLKSKAEYDPGEELDGSIKASLKPAELIPQETEVMIKYGDKERKFKLSNYVDIQTVQGEFFAEGSNLQGSGTGYGVPNTIFPELEIVVKVSEKSKSESSEEEQEETPQETQTTEESTQETEETASQTEEEPTQEETSESEQEEPQTSPEETEEESTQETTSEEESSEPETESAETEQSPSITGSTIAETTFEVKGKVAKDKKFEYNLADDQTAEIISVTLNGKEISNSLVNLEEKENKITVTTDYSEECFGKKCFTGGDPALVFQVDISDLNLQANPDAEGLEITLSHQEQEITSYLQKIIVKDDNQTDQNQTETNQTTQPLFLTQSLPSVKIPAGREATLSLNNYIEGAESYTIEIEDITAKFNGHTLTLTPLQEFQGTRTATLIAEANGETLNTEFSVLVSSKKVKITTTKKQIKVNEPVTLIKTVEKEKEEEINIEIPKEALSIRVQKQQEDGSLIEEEIIEKKVEKSRITGNVVVEIDLEENPEKSFKNSQFGKMWASLKERLGTITGRATTEISEESTALVLESTPVITGEQETQTDSYEIEIILPAPTLEQEKIENGERFTITAEEIEGFTYEDVIVEADLDNTIPVGLESKLKLYWLDTTPKLLTEKEIAEVTTTKPSEVPEEETIEIEEFDTDETILFSPVQETQETISSQSEEPESNSVLTVNVIAELPSENTDLTIPEETVRRSIEFEAFDLNNDGFIDFITYVAPHLSNQTFELIIEITEAQHLDQNREFISDIFPQVSELDGNWSETIADGEYVRVTFEKNLTSENDITVWPRTVTGTPRIEIYEVNGSEIIAEFETLTENQYNKVYLSNLENEQDVFDLKILSGSVEFDHIIDPTDGAPDISFGSGTPADSSTQTNQDIFVNLSTTDVSTHYAFTDFNNDLVLWMRFDEVNSSGDPTDLSSNSRNGTLHGDTLINETGYFGNASHFDGTDDYINLTNDPTIQIGTHDYSFFAWVKTDVSGSSLTILADQPTGNNAFEGFRVQSHATVEYQVVIADGSSYKDYSGSAIDDGAWHHVGFTFERTNDNLTLFLDGSAISPTKSRDDNLTSSDISPSQPIYISSRGNIAQSWNGAMDEFLIFNRSLTTAEVAAIYNASASQYTNNFTNLANGTYTFTGYAVDTLGNKNQTSTRTVTINTSSTPADTTAPNISFVDPTSSDGVNQTNTDIFVNISTQDTSRHYSFVDFDNDLLLWLRMDDVSGTTTVFDLSSYGTNGSTSSEVTLNHSDAVFGNATLFDRVGTNNDYIEVSSNAINNLTQMTLSTWIKPRQSTDADLSGNRNVTIADKNIDPNLPSSWSLILDPVGDNVFFKPLTGTQVSLASGVAYDTWQHLVVIANTSTVELYLNGQLDAQSTGTYDLGQTSSTLLIGTSIRGSANGINDPFGYNGSIDEFMMFNRSFTANEISSLYNATAAQYEHNFTNLVQGTHTFTGYAVDTPGNKNQTETRTVTIDSQAPGISFGIGTENSGERTDSRSVYINISTTNTDDLDTLTYFLFNSSNDLINETRYTTIIQTINFTNLGNDTYTYYATINDTTGNTNITSLNKIINIPRCLDLSTCSELSSCEINTACSLHTLQCTGGSCDFTTMTLNSSIYTLHDDKTGRNLILNITSNATRAPLLFKPNSSIIFNGKNATVIGSGSSGGNAGIVNLTVPDLLNTTNANFSGVGGYSTQSSTAGGDGGTLQLNFHGLIRNFTLGTSDIDLSGGGSVDGIFGSSGTLIYNQDLDTLPRDADVTGDGQINLLDIIAIRNSYNADSFETRRDISGDLRVNVVEFTKIGFEWVNR